MIGHVRALAQRKGELGLDGDRLSKAVSPLTITFDQLDDAGAIMLDAGAPPGSGDAREVPSPGVAARVADEDAAVEAEAGRGRGGAEIGEDRPLARGIDRGAGAEDEEPGVDAGAEMMGRVDSPRAHRVERAPAPVGELDHPARDRGLAEQGHGSDTALEGVDQAHQHPLRDVEVALPGDGVDAAGALEIALPGRLPEAMAPISALVTQGGLPRTRSGSGRLAISSSQRVVKKSAVVTRERSSGGAAAPRSRTLR